MRVYHRYFEHAKPGSAESAWKNMCRLKVVLDIPEDGITETTFSNTNWGQQLKPVGLLDVVYGTDRSRVRGPRSILEPTPSR